jgi:hypothetical protein
MITKIKDINKSIKWEKEKSILIKDFLSSNNLTSYNDKEFWEYISSNKNVKQAFHNSNEYINFLTDFWHNLNPERIDNITMSLMAKNMLSEISTNEDAFYFFATQLQMPFIFFETLILKYSFLLKDINNLSSNEFNYFNKFWSCLFKQHQIPKTFINKHYIYFLNNKKYFSTLLIGHSALFMLPQNIINKFKC